MHSLDSIHVYDCIYICHKKEYMHMTIHIHNSIQAHGCLYTWHLASYICTWAYTHMWVLLWLASAYPNGPLHTFTIEQLRKIFNNTLVLTADPVWWNSLGVGLWSHISKSTKVVLTHSQDGFQLTVLYACFYSRIHWGHACSLLSNTQPVDTYDHEMFRMWLVLTENAYKHNRFSRP